MLYLQDTKIILIDGDRTLENLILTNLSEEKVHLGCSVLLGSVLELVFSPVVCIWGSFETLVS